MLKFKILFLTTIFFYAPSVVEDVDGNLWFGTHTGLSKGILPHSQ